MLPIESYYFLLHAFDVLGRRLFGEEWTRQEYRQAPLPSPEEVTAERAPLEQRIAELDARQEEIEQDIGRSLSAGQLDSLKGDKAALITERTACRERLSHLYRIDDRYRHEYETFTRRRETEKRLFGALASGQLAASYGGLCNLDWEGWSRERGFKVYLETSLVVAPRLRGGARRASVLIPRDAFDEWLKTVLPITAGAIATLSPEEQCRAWLTSLAASGQKPKAKTALCEEALKRFPGLGPRGFRRVWDLHVPASWRRKGRPDAPGK